MKAPARAVETRGFTLMEIMVAFLIFGIVVSTVVASHRAVFVSVPVIEESLDLYAMSGACLERIGLDLRSAYITQPPIYKKPDFNATPDPFRLIGYGDGGGAEDGQRLRFTSYAHLPLEQSKRAGIAEIIYYQRSRGEELFDLMRSDHLYPYPEFEVSDRDPVLCKALKRLEMKFFDNEGNDYTRWDSESDEFDYATPEAIVIGIEMVQGETTAVFETRVAMPVVRQGEEG